jgi:hypothetical protein
VPLHRFLLVIDCWCFLWFVGINFISSFCTQGLLKF